MEGDYGIVKVSNLLMRENEMKETLVERFERLANDGGKNLKLLKITMVVHSGSEDKSGPSPENLRRHPGTSVGAGRPFPA